MEMRLRSNWTLSSTLALAAHLRQHYSLRPKMGPHPFDPKLADLSGEQRTEAMPLEPQSFMAHIDATLMEQVLNVPKGQREADIQHHRETDDLGARLEIAEGTAFGHVPKLVALCPGSSLVLLTGPSHLSDSTRRRLRY